LRVLRGLLAALVVAWASFAAAAPIEFLASVVRVTDGDTIVVEGRDDRRDKVRIVSIDAPEKGRRGLRGQPYSERSRQHLVNMVDGKTLRLVSRGYDDYGRVLARVWVGGTDIGLAQVCAGYAWVFEAFVEQLSPAEQQTYRACQITARTEKRGLWRESQPTPPWVWRHSQPR